MTMYLLDPFGQRRRAGLQDVRGLDLEDVTAFHRRDLVPPRSRADPGGADRLPAPRPDDDVWRGGDHLIARDDTILRELRVSDVREHRITARNLDELFHPSDAADQRIVPLLEVDARAPRPSRGRSAMSELQVTPTSSGS